MRHHQDSKIHQNFYYQFPYRQCLDNGVTSEVIQTLHFFRAILKLLVLLKI